MNLITNNYASQVAQYHVLMAGASRAVALNLYRRWLKAASHFPEKRLRNKLRFVGTHGVNTITSVARSPSQPHDHQSSDHEAAVVASKMKCEAAPICTCRYNVREVFELYRHETNSSKIKDVIEKGEEDLLAFSQIQKLDAESLQVLMTSGRAINQSRKH